MVFPTVHRTFYRQITFFFLGTFTFSLILNHLNLFYWWMTWPLIASSFVSVSFSNKKYEIVRLRSTADQRKLFQFYIYLNTKILHKPHYELHYEQLNNTENHFYHFSFKLTKNEIVLSILWLLYLIRKCLLKSDVSCHFSSSYSSFGCFVIIYIFSVSFFFVFRSLCLK